MFGSLKTREQKNINHKEVKSMANIKKYTTRFLICSRGHVVDKQYPLSIGAFEGDTCSMELSHDILQGGTTYCRRKLMAVPLLFKGKELITFLLLMQENNLAWAGEIAKIYDAEYIKHFSSYTRRPVFKHGYIEDFKITSHGYRVLFNNTDHNGKRMWILPENIRLRLKDKHIER
jgi:hypothetical protein